MDLEPAAHGAVTTTTPAEAAARPPKGLATVDIAIPVLNEERALPGCIATLCEFLGREFPFPWRITIVDNGSTDGTWETAVDLAARYPQVSARRLNIRGRGAAVKAAWNSSDADIVVYMDVDLSTGLDALLPLVAPLATGHCEISIGSRLARGARTRRRLRREVISRTYNSLVRYGFGMRCSDTQLGFKAARLDAVRPLLERIEDDAWFFDTELLILAEHNGLRVHEVPVDWVEDTDSRVRVASAAIANLKGLARINRAICSGRATVEVPRVPNLRATHPDPILARPRAETLAKFASFAVIGIISTIVYTLIYLPARTAMPPAAANLLALVLVAVCNTEANRRYTFNRAGGPRFVLHLRAAVVFTATYLLTTLAVTAVTQRVPGAGPALEIGVLILAYGLVTVLRFVALDRWIFARRGDRRAP
jgi:glycosyltransferase involved in cell wall biosynthesis/putative flippase GtrA